MKRLLLMNSAVIVNDGVYEAKKITEEEAKSIVSEALHTKAHMLSYVGYEQTALHMAKVLGVDVPLNRSETQYEDGDYILVCKLKYRLKNPNEKGQPVDPEDFEWMLVQYRK